MAFACSAWLMANWAMSAGLVSRMTPAVMVEMAPTVPVPKSAVSDAEDYAEGDVDVCMSLSEWICREKGIGE